MDPKENARRILRFDGPQRIVGGLPTASCSYRGVNCETLDGSVGHNSPAGSRWTDIWGVGWRKELEGVMGFDEVNPLADLSRIDSHPWPDPDDERICGRIYALAEGADTDRAFLSGGHRETLWERAYHLVGMDNLMVAFYTEPGAVRDLLHRIMDFQVGIARHYLEVGVEVVGLGDDLGAQHSTLMSREQLDEFFVPEYRRLTDLYNASDAIITMHSCGHVAPFLDFFMDLGVQVLNPVQATANDLEHVREVTRGRMTLAGAVSSDTIMRGPREAICAEVRERLWQLGRGGPDGADGGYLCGPDQGLPFPQEHVDALHEAIEEFGTYPLSPPAG